MDRDVADHFRTFAERGARRTPVTQRLAAGAAGDDEVLALVRDVSLERRPSNLLLAAAHDLLLRGIPHPLGRWYPTVGGDPAAAGDPYPAFRSLLLEHAGEVRALLATRETQTNEVGRCSALRAGLVAVTGGEACSLVDVGASAGLTLLVDRYRVSYEPGGEVGPEAATVRIRCSVRDDGRPPMGPIAIHQRIGLDRAPVDVDDADATRWLVACTWPDDAERSARLLAALDVARAERPEVVRGDAIADLHRVVPAAGPVVLQHSWMAPYLGDDGRRAYTAEVERLATGRPQPLWWLFAEQPSEVPGLPVPDGDPLATALVVVRWDRGSREVTRLADLHPHGRWLRWLAS